MGLPNSQDALLQTLDITFDGQPLSCHGVTSKNKLCTVRISKANSDRVKTLLGSITKKQNFREAKKLFEEVSLLLMCKRYHRDQSSSLLQRWERALSKANFVQLRVLKDEYEGVGRGVSDTEIKEEDVQVKSKKKAKAQPRASPSVDRPNASKEQSRSPKPSVPTHKFEPFGQKKTTLQINQAIKRQLLRPLLSSEKPRLDEGFIYMYTFPSSYRLSSPPLKIGYTLDVNKRMAQWGTQCGYAPKILNYTGAELYVKVEKLVHKQLGNERRRETCPGCGSSHKEWFEVKSWKALEVVGLWTDWSRREPYDGNGNLKEKWVRRLEEIDLSKPRCWEVFVNDQDDEEEST